MTKEENNSIPHLPKPLEQCNLLVFLLYFPVHILAAGENFLFCVIVLVCVIINRVLRLPFLVDFLPFFFLKEFPILLLPEPFFFSFFVYLSFFCQLCQWSTFYTFTISLKNWKFNFNYEVFKQFKKNISFSWIPSRPIFLNYVAISWIYWLFQQFGFWSNSIASNFLPGHHQGLFVLFFPKGWAQILDPIFSITGSHPKKFHFPEN